MINEFSPEELTSLLETVFLSRYQLNRARERRNEGVRATKAISTVTLGKNPSVNRARASLSQAVKAAETDLELAGVAFRTYMSGLGTYLLPEVLVTQEETENRWDARIPGYAVSVSVQGFDTPDKDSQRNAVTLLNVLNYFSTIDLEKAPSSSEKLARELDTSSAVISGVGFNEGHDSMLVIDSISQDEFKIFVSAGAEKGRGITRGINRAQADYAIYNMHALSKRLHDRGMDLKIEYDYFPLSD